MHASAPASTAFLLAAVLTLGSGCVAFNVGKPVVVIDEHDIPEKQTAPVSVHVLSARPQCQQQSLERVSVGLGADVEETFEKRVVRETWTIRKQRRLGIGLFPGASEVYLMPDGALTSAIFGNPNSIGEYQTNPLNERGLYVGGQFAFLLGSCGVVQLVGTVNSLLVEPFAPWECAHDLVDPDCIRQSSRREGCWSASDSPKLRLVDKHGDRLGVHTCHNQKENNFSFATHLGLIGIHKHVAVFVDGPERGPSTVAGTETKRRTATANGPYVVEFSIPELNHYDWKRVASRDAQATFPLPVAPQNCRTDAIVRFRPDENAGAPDELTRKALDKTAGNEFRVEVNLQGGGTPGKPRKYHEIVDITPSGDGQYVVRVKILDRSKTFAIGRNVENEVRRLIREDYVGKHPEKPEGDVRETVRWETEDDGDVLVYTGWAFSVQSASSFYDAESRRGRVSLRIASGMSAEDARRWARENIAAIVSDKNVVNEAGKAPPPGARFRSLSESLENGILTVEFEAVE